MAWRGGPELPVPPNPIDWKQKMAPWNESGRSWSLWLLTYHTPDMLHCSIRVNYTIRKHLCQYTCFRLRIAQ